MSYQLIVNSVTAEELTQKINSLAAQFGVDLSKAPTTSTPSIQGEPVDEVKEEKAKRTRKPKTEKVEDEKVEDETMEEVASPFTQQVTQDPQPTKEQISTALQQLSAKTNIEMVKKVLSQFGAKRVSDLKEEQYRDVMLMIIGEEEKL